MSARGTHQLACGVRVVTPESMDLITPYVLREQQDWFEDEIRFVRRVLRPGEQAIDIGANYGVYALSMAQAVGASGRVWAYEPATSTAAFLAEGIAANGFGHVALERKAVSRESGSARLSVHADAELNALVRDAGAGPSETVPVVTLDEAMASHGWDDIALLKIDAEGEESAIIEGGAAFFSRLSPLVLYEVKAGEALHLELVERLASRGMRSWRLAPGPGLLVPFDPAQPADGYLLNLFACNPQRAAQLAAAGLLVEHAGAAPPAARQQDAWQQSLRVHAYAGELAKAWSTSGSGALGKQVEEALAWHAMSRDATLGATERFAALQAAFRLFKHVCERQPSHLRLASLARAAREFGARAVAVGALQALVDGILASGQVDVQEPFLAPAPRYEAMPVAAAEAGNWILAAALEEFERLAAFSSFYTGPTALQRLELIARLGWGSPEMQRRLELVKQRAARA